MVDIAPLSSAYQTAFLLGFGVALAGGAAIGSECNFHSGPAGLPGLRNADVTNVFSSTAVRLPSGHSSRRSHANDGRAR